MTKSLAVFTGLLWGVWPIVAAQEGVVEGTVRKVDATSRKITVDTARGTADTFDYVDSTAIHGTKDGAKMGKKALDGLKDGDEVAVHYTTKGTEKTAGEIDRIGKDGLKAAKGTLSDVDRGTKTAAVKTSEGGKEVFDLSRHGAVEAGDKTARGTKDAAQVLVYYTDEGGKKVAHYIKRIF